jgi:hypothetical protein
VRDFPPEILLSGIDKKFLSRVFRRETHFLMSQTIQRDVQLQGGASSQGVAVSKNPVRLRNIALPVEHGGWGLSLEPVVLGLLVAPSIPGMFLAVATLAAFLARYPLKLAMGDRRNARRFPRSLVAERFALLYISVASLSLVAALATATSYQLLLPLLLASPLALVQLHFDRIGRSRTLLPELSGATAMASIATSIALAGGWPSTSAFGLWAILTARVVPTMLYVRARVKALRRQPAPASPVIAIHLLAFVAALLLAWAKAIPALPAVVPLILLGRAVYGFSIYDRATTARQTGFRELGFGAMTVITVALSYYLHL